MLVDDVAGMGNICLSSVLTLSLSQETRVQTCVDYVAGKPCSSPPLTLSLTQETRVQQMRVDDVAGYDLRVHTTHARPRAPPAPAPAPPPAWPPPRGLHSFTFRVNLSAFCGTRGAWGVLDRYLWRGWNGCAFGGTWGA
jgi:hypothetical protein